MAASDLRDIIVAKMATFSAPMDESVPARAHAAISESITQYVNSIVKLQGDYSGIIPGSPPTPELAPNDLWTVVGTMPPLSVPGDFQSWVAQVEAYIKSSFYTGFGVSHPLSPVPAFPNFTLSADQNALYDKHMNAYDDPYPDTMLIFCEWIIDGLKIGFVPSVSAGIVGSGTFVVSKIIT